MPEIIRKLASLQQITAISPIPNADTIEVVTIKGWKVVVKKSDNFKVGDLAVYIEIDSILPDRPDFAFLKDKQHPDKPIRLRTVRLRGQISQGIVFKMDIVPSFIPTEKIEAFLQANPNYPAMVLDGKLALIGMINVDITALLDITKYDPPMPACLAGEMKGKFPWFMSKTDEERIQNAIQVLEIYKDTPFYVTEKIDGTSGTFYFFNGEFGVCGRQWELRDTPTNTHWIMARKYDIDAKMRKLGLNIAIQGEIIGEGINKNKYALKGQQLHLFSVYFIDQTRYGNFEELIEIAKKLGIPTVPIVDTSYRLPKTVEALLEYATAPSQLNPKTIREGVVIRSIVEFNEANLGGRLSFKVISNDFLLKHNSD